MKQDWPYVKTIIDILTDETLYEFDLEGKFHDMAGLDFNVQWDDVAVGSGNSTIIAWRTVASENLHYVF